MKKLKEAIKFTKQNTKYYILAFPLVFLIFFFIIPLILMILTSFYTNLPAGFYTRELTFQNYLKFFSSSFYLSKMLHTIQISFLTGIICLVLGYPVAYYLARLKSNFRRNLYMTIITATLWITYIVRAYAWKVILAGVGPISKTLLALGIISEPHSFAPGYGAVLIGMIYAFLPFMILSLYGSISNIDVEVEEASLNLGARPFTTFVKIVLPLSINGIISGFLLVFVLALGVYVTAAILGSPSEWTLAIFIGDVISDELNLPLGAAMSMFMISLVVVMLGLLSKITSLISGRG